MRLDAHHSSGTPHIARAPLSMDKLSCLPSQGTVRYSSDFNPAIGDTTKVLGARDFITAATLFMPPQGVRLIRYFELVLLTQPLAVAPVGSYHPSRPAEWKETHGVENEDSRPQPPPCIVPESACRSLGRQPSRKKRREPPGLDLAALN